MSGQNSRHGSQARSHRRPAREFDLLRVRPGPESPPHGTTWYPRRLPREPHVGAGPSADARSTQRRVEPPGTHDPPASAPRSWDYRRAPPSPARKRGAAGLEAAAGYPAVMRGGTRAAAPCSQPTTSSRLLERAQRDAKARAECEYASYYCVVRRIFA